MRGARACALVGLCALASACAGSDGKKPKGPDLRRDPAEPTPSEIRVSDAPLPAPAFLDPERPAKLRAALPAVEAAVRAAAPSGADATLAVVIDGEVALTVTTGKLAPDAALPLGGLLDGLAALVVLELAEEGTLGLDDPLEYYLPEAKELAYPSADAARVTVRMVLEERAGLPAFGPPGKDGAAALVGLKLEQPGESRPSRLGAQLLAVVAERTTGKPIDALVRTRVLEPAGAGAVTHADEGWRGPLAGVAAWAGFVLRAFPGAGGPEAGPLARRLVRALWTQGGPEIARVAQPCDAVRLRQRGAAPEGELATTSALEVLPDRGVAFAAHARGDVDAGALIESALRELERSGALRPRELPASEGASEAARSYVELRNAWDEARATALFGSRLTRERPVALWAARLGEARGRSGACQPPTISAAGRDRVTATSKCDRGTLELTLEVAPGSSRAEVIEERFASPIEEAARLLLGTGACPER